MAIATDTRYFCYIYMDNFGKTVFHISLKIVQITSGDKIPSRNGYLRWFILCFSILRVYVWRFFNPIPFASDLLHISLLFSLTSLLSLYHITIWNKAKAPPFYYSLVSVEIGIHLLSSCTEGPDPGNSSAPLSEHITVKLQQKLPPEALYHFPLL